jgi:hypothetical protein
MEKATGQSIEKTVAQFAELAHSPAEAAAKLNEQFNFLTASVYKQIKALQDQGRLVDAQNLAEKTYADALKTRAQSVLDSAGTMEKAWRGVSSIAKKAWDDMLGIGRTLSPAEQLAQAAAKVAEIQAQIKAATSFSETAGGAAVGRTGGANLASLQRQLEAARELQRMAEQRVDGERSVGAALAANNRLQQLGIQYQQDGEQFLTQQQQKNRELTKAQTEGQQLVAAGIITQTQLTQRLQQIREKYNNTTGLDELAQLKAQAQSVQSTIELLRQKMANNDTSDVTKLTDAEQKVYDIQQKLKTTIPEVTRARLLDQLAVAQELVSGEKTLKLTQDQEAAWRRSVAVTIQQSVAASQQAEAIDEAAQQQEAANATFGKSRTAVEALVLAQLRLQATEAESSERFDPHYVAGVNAKVVAQERYVKALQDAENKQAALNILQLHQQNADDANLLQYELTLVGETADKRTLLVEQRRIELDYARKIAEEDRKGGSQDEIRARKASLEQEKLVALNNATTRKVVDQWQRAADDINSSLTDALARWAENGESLGKGLRDSLKRMFDQLVLRPTISAAFNATGLPGLLSQTGIGAANGLGNLFGVGNVFPTLGSSTSSLFGAGSATDTIAGAFGFGSGAGGAAITSSEIASTAAATESMLAAAGGAADAGAAASALAGSMEAAGAAAGTFGAGMTAALSAIPVAGWVLAAVALASAIAGSGETRTGGQYGFSFDGTTVANPRRGTTIGATGIGPTFLEGPSGGDSNSQAASDAINGTVATISQILKGVGSAVTLTAFQAGYEASKEDRGGVFTGGTFSSGAAFGESGKGDNYAGTLFESTSARSGDLQTIFNNFITDQKQSVIEAIQSLVGVVPKTLTDMVEGVNAEGLSDAAAQAIVDKILGIVTAVTDFSAAIAGLPSSFDALKTASFDVKASVITALGGAQTATAAIAGFFDKYFTEEEKRAALQAQLVQTFAQAGVTLPATIQAYRDAVLEAQQHLDTDAGRTAFETLIKNADAFYQAAQTTAAAVDTATDSLAEAIDKLRNPVRSIQDIAQNIVGLEKAGQSLQVQLLQAQGNSPAAQALQRQLDTAGLTDAEIAAYDHNQAIRDEIDTLDAATAAQEKYQQATKSLTDETQSLTVQLLQAQGDTAGAKALQRQIDTAGMDAAQIAIYDYNQQLHAEIDALGAAAAAQEKYQQATKSLTDQTQSLTVQLLQAQGDIAGAKALQRQLDTAGMDAAQIAIYDLNQSIRDQITAASAATQAQQKAAQAAQQLRQQWLSVADGVLAEVQRLRGAVAGTGPQGFEAAQAQFAVATAKARAGDVQAFQSLPSLEQAIVQLAQDNAPSIADLRYLEAQLAASLATTAAMVTSRSGGAAADASTGTASRRTVHARTVDTFTTNAAMQVVDTTPLEQLVVALTQKVTDLEDQLVSANLELKRIGNAVNGNQENPIQVEDVT